MIFIFLSQISLSYLILVKPYEERATNSNEIFNELCVLTCSYLLFVFTDFVDSLKTNEIFGYILIGVIFVNFSVNILIQVGALLLRLPLLLTKLKRAVIFRSLVSAQGKTIPIQSIA